MNISQFKTRVRLVCDGCAARLSNNELRRGERACWDCLAQRLIVQAEPLLARIRQEHIEACIRCLRSRLSRAAPARGEIG